MPRRFTLLEAEALLPEVEKAIRDALSARERYESAGAVLADIKRRIETAGGAAVDRTVVLENRVARDQCGERLKSAIEQIQSLGCEVKDLDVGLVDFHTLYRGREVCLCWKLGESGISWWHGIQDGFAGRKPIDDEFLRNHRGDTAQ